MRITVNNSKFKHFRQFQTNANNVSQTRGVRSSLRDAVPTITYCQAKARLLSAKFFVNIAITII